MEDKYFPSTGDQMQEPNPYMQVYFPLRRGAVENVYDCPHCKDGLFKDQYEVRHVPHGHTDKYSTWGSGYPTTRLECNLCGRWSGPWVSADLVYL